MSTSLWHLPQRFGALDEQQSHYDTAKAVVVPLPYDATTCFRPGTRDGPAAIVSASSQLELFDEELLFEPASVGIATLAPLEPDTRGPEWMIQAIRAYCLPSVRDGKFVVALGGEHSVSLGCLDAQISHLGKDICVLYVDAHADLRDNYQGSSYSHACTARRMLERCQVVGVGMRAYSREEHDFIQRQDLRPVSMGFIRNTPDWIDRLVERLESKVYISLDLDCLDPGVCPGVGTPEPGGLEWRELLQMLRAVYAQREVVGVDVVECLPLPGQHLSEFVAARLVYKMIAYQFERSLAKLGP